MATVSNIDINLALSLIDKKWLYNGLWRLKGDEAEGEEIFERLISDISDYKFDPKIVYGEFDLKSLPFELDRSSLKELSQEKPVGDKVFLLSATVGDEVMDAAESLRRGGEYADYFYLSGLAAATAEAATEYAHMKIAEESGFDFDASFRISPGYPAWPGLSSQHVIARLLPLDDIGVFVGETNQLIPEYSTTAMVLILKT